MTKERGRRSLPGELREGERLTRIYREDMLMAVLTDGKKWTIAEIQTRLRRAGLASMSNKEMRKRLKTLVEEEAIGRRTHPAARPPGGLWVAATAVTRRHG